MASPDRVSQEEHARVRVALDGTGASNVSSGLPVLDHLLGLLARYGALDLELQLAPDDPEAEVASAGRTLGQALREPLSSDEVRGHGSGVAAADDALAHIVLEASGRPLVVSNVDLSGARVGGLGKDVVASFLHELAEGGGFTLHVRLIDGDDPQHVLEAIFKALGVALAQAGRPRKRRD
jgi:imidazoleglycerol-phosphate dehydratase